MSLRNISDKKKNKIKKRHKRSNVKLDKNKGFCWIVAARKKYAVPSKQCKNIRKKSLKERHILR